MCLHYLGCDLSPTLSTSIMHHIHKQAADLGAPATHSYYFNWIKSEQISGARLPHCGFSIPGSRLIRTLYQFAVW